MMTLSVQPTETHNDIVRASTTPSNHNQTMLKTIAGSIVITKLLDQSAVGTAFTYIIMVMAHIWIVRF